MAEESPKKPFDAGTLRLLDAIFGLDPLEASRADETALWDAVDELGMTSSEQLIGGVGRHRDLSMVTRALYPLDGTSPTLATLAKELGVTSVRVGQLRRLALMRLRQPRMKYRYWPRRDGTIRTLTDDETQALNAWNPFAEEPYPLDD